MAEVESGWSLGGLGPIHDSGESASGPKGDLGMEVAVDHRLAGGRGYSAGGLGCLLPDVCWLTSEVASPRPVVVEPVRRELSVSARLAS